MRERERESEKSCKSRGRYTARETLLYDVGGEHLINAIIQIIDFIRWTGTFYTHGGVCFFIIIYLYIYNKNIYILIVSSDACVYLRV